MLYASADHPRRGDRPGDRRWRCGRGFARRERARWSTTVSAALSRLRGRGRAAVRVRGQAGLVPGARGPATASSTGVKHLTLPALALAISVRRARRPRDADGGARRAAAASTCRPRSAAACPVALIVAPPRAAQRGDPDHHRRRHHDRLADRAVGGGRDARSRSNGLGAYLVQAAQNKDFAVVQGISLVLVVGFVITNTIVDVALRAARPAGHAREPCPVSIESLDPVAQAAARPPPTGAGLREHRLGRPRLSLGVIVVRAARRDVRAASSRRTTRTSSHLSLRLRRPGRRPPARLRRPGPRPARAGCSRAPARRCFGAGARRAGVVRSSSALALAIVAAWRGGRFDATSSRWSRRAVRLPRHPARDHRRGRVRAEPEVGGDRALDRLHAVHRAGAARRGDAASGRMAVHRRAARCRASAAMAICVRHLLPNISSADRRPGHDPVRLSRWSTSRRSRSSGSACRPRRPTGA